jgi:N utilization substance protein B
VAVSKRYAARRLAVQALYQTQLNERDIETLLAQFRQDQGYPGADAEYFEGLLQDAFGARDMLDDDIRSYGDIAPEQLDPVERAVLWVALTELRLRADVPVRVVLNEAVELAKQFGAEGGHRFVNGLLDQAAASLRAARA